MSAYAALMPCPCGSGAAFGLCCGPFLDRTADPPTVEALMRSRYTAFCLKAAGYLMDTWDPARRPRTLDFGNDDTRWQGLRILSVREAADQGEVSFEARFRQGETEGVLREDSRFRRRDGRWFYVDGSFPGSEAAAPGRNAPCPCGSGRKFKRCCG